MDRQSPEPYEICFEEDGKGVFIDCTGTVNFERLTVTTEAMYSSDDQHRLRYQIWSTLGADRMELSGDELRAMAMQDRDATRGYPRQAVAIVGSDELFRGAPGIYGVYADVWADFETRAFESVPAAREWIRDWLRGPQPGTRSAVGEISAQDPANDHDI